MQTRSAITTRPPPRRPSRADRLSPGFSWDVDHTALPPAGHLPLLPLLLPVPLWDLRTRHRAWYTAGALYMLRVCLRTEAQSAQASSPPLPLKDRGTRPASGTSVPAAAGLHSSPPPFLPSFEQEGTLEDPACPPALHSFRGRGPSSVFSPALGSPGRRSLPWSFQPFWPRPPELSLPSWKRPSSAQ